MAFAILFQTLEPINHISRILIIKFLHLPQNDMNIAKTTVKGLSSTYATWEKRNELNFKSLQDNFVEKCCTGVMLKLAANVKKRKVRHACMMNYLSRSSD